LAASTLLSSLVEWVISVHHERLLSLLTDPLSIEDYGKVSDKLNQAIKDLMKAVRKLREWDAGGVGKWDEARLVHHSVIVESYDFVKALQQHVEFCGRVLKPVKMMRMGSNGKLSRL
jgi:hypothetical protein